MIDFERLTTVLKQKNMRVTQARKEIYSLLGASEVSLSVREVYKEICRGRGNTDLASVYRNLQLFSKLGLIHRFQDGRFANCHQQDHCAEDPNLHIHIISHCKICGISQEMKSHSKKVRQLAQDIKTLGSALDSFKEVIIQGKCRKCSQA